MQPEWPSGFRAIRADFNSIRSDLHNADRLLCYQTHYVSRHILLPTLLSVVIPQFLLEAFGKNLFAFLLAFLPVLWALTLCGWSFERMQKSALNCVFGAPCHIELSSHLASGADELNIGLLASSSSSPCIPSPSLSPSSSSTSSPSFNSFETPSSLSFSSSSVRPSSASVTNSSKGHFWLLLLLLQLVYAAFPWPLLPLL